MKQLTPAEFKNAVASDPAWALGLTEPVEITGYCDMKNSGITHLSPLLHFTNPDARGNAASFPCKKLKTAEGTFHGSVDFADSGIEKIGELTIVAPNHDCYAASFCGCTKLTVAEGTFPGFVHFGRTGVTRIGELAITQPHVRGGKANFCGCDIKLPIEFLGTEFEMDEPTRQKNLRRIAASRAHKSQPDLEI